MRSKPGSTRGWRRKPVTDAWKIYAEVSKTVAKAGCVCVCIRHRGAFPVLPLRPAVVALSVVAPAVLAVFVPSLLLPMCLLLPALSLAASGAATHEEMMDDVASALLWVREHRAELTAAPDLKPQDKVIFGGYSSGAHVATCLLQRPELPKSFVPSVASRGEWGYFVETALLPGYRVQDFEVSRAGCTLQAMQREVPVSARAGLTALMADEPSGGQATSRRPAGGADDPHRE